MGSQRDQTADDKVQEGLMESRKDNDAAAKGCWQKLWSYKIRFVYFLVVSLTLLIAVIVLAATRPQPEASSTTHEKIIYVQCDDGWNPYKGNCYYLSGGVKSWTDSQTYCTEHKSSLAIIDTKEEYNFLKNIKGENNPWIGLSKRGDGSGWVRADGKPYSEDISQIVQVTNPGDMGYAYLTSEGVTIETREDLPKKFFCKKKLFTQPA